MSGSSQAQQAETEFARSRFLDHASTQQPLRMRRDATRAFSNAPSVSSLMIACCHLRFWHERGDLRGLMRLLGTKPAMCGIRRSSLARGARCAVSGDPTWHVAPDVRRILAKMRRCAAVSGTGRPKCEESHMHFARHVPNATADYLTSGSTCHRAAAAPEADAGPRSTGAGGRAAPRGAGAGGRMAPGAGVRRQAAGAGGWHRRPADGTGIGREAPGGGPDTLSNGEAGGSPYDDGRIGTGGAPGPGERASGPTRNQLEAPPPRAQRGVDSLCAP